MIQSFGPAAVHGDDGALRISCVTSRTHCFQLCGQTCRDQSPPREIPDTSATPDWCKYRQQTEQDFRDDQEMRALGLHRLTRAELSSRLKAMPIDARGTCPVNKRPWKLPEMNADMMRYALLRAHRAAALAGDASPC